MGRAGGSRGRPITIPFAARPLQLEIDSQLKKNSVLVCHRRFGKTVYCINKLIRDAVQNKKRNPRYAYIAPLRNQAKQIAWDYLKFYAKHIPGVTFNEAELRADFKHNGARIILFGADNPDALRGIYLDGVVLDEYAQMSPRMWGEIIRPTLIDRKGYAIFIGTPMGRNQFWDIYHYAQKNPAWLALMYRASDTGIIDNQDLLEARGEMSAEQYAQEFECSFTAAIIGAYYGALLSNADQEGRICSVPHDPAMPVDTAWDLGMGDSTVIWFFQETPGGEVHVIDYYEASGEPISHYVKVLESKEKYVWGVHYAPHDIEVRELGTGKTRKEIAKSLGVNFETVERHSVDDGIEAVRSLLPKCWFDETNTGEQGIEALRHYRKEYSDKNRVFTLKPLHDWASHPSDAFRIYAMGRKTKIDKKKLHPRRAATRGLNNWMGF